MFNLRLHDDWVNIIKHGWSVRFIAVAALLSGLEVSLPLIQPYVNISPVLVGAAAGVASVGAFIARIVAQKEFEEIDHGYPPT